MTRIISIIMLVFSISCNDDKNKNVSSKDGVLGLEIGMKKKQVDSILSNLYQKKELINFGVHLTQIRESENLKITTDLFEPKYKNEILNNYLYVIQPQEKTGNFSDDFHKRILDDLKIRYGNAKSVIFPSNTKSELTWILNKQVEIKLIIDKEEETYSLSYSKIE